MKATLNRPDINYEDEHQKARFEPIIIMLDFYRIQDCVAKIRIVHSSASAVGRIRSPLFGSYHALFPIGFDDSTCWLLKIPALATEDKWTTQAATALESEALMMQMLKRETKVPIPRVFEFANDLNNELGLPFILMEFIKGRSLYDVWFDQTTQRDERMKIRSQALKGVAAAMVQLGLAPQ